ncbi:hypothetical protein [Beijerinckia sp. L45]|uniref:hypothetical protein n=1 Tax=Beijerinckia sp. L45 TaxID=1641855 RepID=UPI00157698DD|nr:hypothetical protein [Beijerinckia sp. L45]
MSDATAAVASAQVEPRDLGAAWRTIDVGPPMERVASEALRVLGVAPDLERRQVRSVRP